ncbi:tRNA (guanosine(37)-N1)-methyltransferase TrmD [uncultured Senegalimassilia sp.]|uniref:tRNA (guanosine(37)-N1)-methyltransferase TrmD n=1 Tax=uncultured Senegalimassilia sp. TaxID=1714350 RepID=UPI0025DD6CA2|nr:tRNA (guanosine(37)-N1)-methyltransferase TrmD [uncultured Senegalimassilia sp.]
MIIETLSTFPDMYESVMGASMMRIAQEKGILDFKAHDLRDWTHDRHRTTDDEPYGGGDGLVMKCAPIFEAYESLCASPCGGSDAADRASGEGAADAAGQIPGEGSASADAEQALSAASAAADQEASKPYTIFLAPQGRRFDDACACELAKQDRLLFICGHYEGIDERAYTLADEVISLGDYVLTSGELASMVVIDAVVRKLPGVLGAETGALGESFADGLLEYPQYTRPANFNGMEVPAVLLSGNHGAVDRWRREQSLERTYRLRPDLLEGMELPDADRAFLQSLSTEEQQ